MSKELNLKYKIGPEIGRGKYGTVRRCTSPESGEQFAVKTIDKRLLSSDPLDRECLHQETKLHRLAAASNPHVLQIHAVYEDSSSLHLVLDLCPNLDLFDRISANSPIPERDAAPIMASLMDALAGCHRRGVAHRDVKPENVLFDEGGRLRLADFGSAAAIGEMVGVVGTPYYVAPEVLGGGEYGEKVDVWSAGVVMYVMLVGEPPFYGETAAEVFEAVVRGGLRFPARLFRGVSPAAKDMMRRMMCRDASRRLSAEQVLRHKWITSAGEARKEEV